MTYSLDDELADALAELRVLFPDWRMGQLIASLTQAAGREGDAAVWEVDDGDLLAAARRMIERNQVRQAVPVRHA